MTEINNLFAGFISHQSTWLVIRDAERAQWLKDNACGPELMAIRLRINLIGEDSTMIVYNSLDLFSLLERLSTLAQKPLAELMIKSVDEGKFKRLDNRFKNAEVNKINTLKDLEIKDGSTIVVAVKGDN